MRVGGQRHALAALPPARAPVLIGMDKVGPRASLDAFWWGEYPLPLPGTDPRPIQPLPSHHTDYANPPPFRIWCFQFHQQNFDVQQTTFG
jgi:hypothetical protein